MNRQLNPVQRLERGNSSPRSPPPRSLSHAPPTTDELSANFLSLLKDRKIYLAARSLYGGHRLALRGNYGSVLSVAIIIRIEVHLQGRGRVRTGVREPTNTRAATFIVSEAPVPLGSLDLTRAVGV